MARILRSSLALCALLAAAACTNPDRLGTGGADGTVGAVGLDQSALNAAANSSSTPAFFQNSVGDRVLFAVDQSTLSAEARALLDSQAQWLANNSAYSAIIEGHADEQGTREYNLALGAKRASAVRTYLVSRGVAGNRLRTVSFGKERPIEVCSVESCYAKNRRAVTVLNAGAGS
ncbi:MAG: peptidoglycan-associated lipoprotein Pal [Planctomycetota bacterium]